MTDSTSLRETRKIIGLPLFLVGLAAALRFTGLDFGLPLHLHPDEWTQVDTARHMVLSGDLNPHFFRYPSFFIYQLAALDLPNRGIGDPASFYWFGRWLSAAYGVLTVSAVFQLGRLALNRWIGVGAALLVALSPELVRQSHYATVDVAMTFWGVAAIALALAVPRRPSRIIALAGVAAGLALATKYTAIYIVIPLAGLVAWQAWLARAPGWGWMSGRRGALALILVGLGLAGSLWLLPVDSVLNILRSWTTDGVIRPDYLNLFNSALLLGWGVSVGLCALGLGGCWHVNIRRFVQQLVHPRVGLFAGMAFGAFALTSPFVLLDLPHAARDIVYEYRHVMIGAAAQYESTRAGLVAPPPAAPFSQPLFYWAWWLRQNGWPLTLLLIPGAIILNRRRPAAFWTVAVIVAAVAFTLTRAGNKAERYATLLIPLLAIAAGAGLWWVRQRAMDMEHGPLLRAMISVTLLAAFAWPAVDSARLVYREFWLPDTRVLALRWLEAHAEPGALVVREDKTTDVENAPTPYRVISVLSLFAEHSLDDWRQQGARYLLVGPMRDQYLKHPELYPAEAAAYLQLEAEVPLATIVTPMAGVGPVIRIYQLP